MDSPYKKGITIIPPSPPDRVVRTQGGNIAKWVAQSLAQSKQVANIS